MKLAVTIDTEEDSWRPFSTTTTTRNAREIARVHDLFVTEGIRPSYLVTWPMALDDGLVEVLGPEQHAGRCEVGMHCHPWTTPPYGEDPRPYNSMLCNLPRERVAAKLHALHRLITQRFDVAPRTFRAGRWGYGPAVAEVLLELGYRVDTSVTAFTNWSAEFGPNYSGVGPEPYRFTPPRIYEPAASGAMLELPATAGYLQRGYRWYARIEHLIRRRPLRWLHLLGILDRLSLLNRVTLSPECASARQMIALLDTMQALGFDYANLFFHSPTLLPGLTPFVKTYRERDDFLRTLRTVLRHARSTGITPIFAGEVIDDFAPVEVPDEPRREPRLPGVSGAALNTSKVSAGPR